VWQKEGLEHPQESTGRMIDDAVRGTAGAFGEFPVVLQVRQRDYS
jgi:hypothetical protein